VKPRTWVVLLLVAFVSGGIILSSWLQYATHGGDHYYPVFVTGQPACSLSSDARSVVVVIPLRDARGGRDVVQSVKLLDAATVPETKYGWLPSGIGYANGEAHPSQRDLKTSFEAKDGLGTPGGNFVFAVPVRSLPNTGRIDAIELSVATGEPSYVQQIQIGATIKSTSCTVTTATAG
jgi:hypothetical protein